MARLLVVAGEASADALAAEALGALGALAAVGVGGPRAVAAGLRALARAEAISVMGIGDVVGELGRLVRLQQRLAALGRRWPAQAALLVDLPDFNLPLGDRLRQAGVPVVGVVAPQAWAWRQERARRVAESYDRLLVLFPFEAPFFRDRGVNAEFIGHPLAWRPPAAVEERDALVLMPGSRGGEVRRHLPALLASVEGLQRLSGARRVLLPRAATLPREALAAARGVEIVEDSHAALSRARLVVSGSGTACLEAALAGAPTVVVWRGAPSTFAVARALVRTRFIAMPNLLLDRLVFPELIQWEVRPQRILEAARWVLGRADTLAADAERLRAMLRAEATPGALMAQAVGALTGAKVASTAAPSQSA